MTLVTLAVATGLHYNRISQIESGLAVSHRDALRLANAYGQQVSGLFEKIGEEAAAGAS